MWAFTKRIVLFLLLNFVILVTISFILSLFNVQPYLTQSGLDYTSLLIFCFIWGMVGAFISLALSRVMAKWMMGVRVINPDSAIGDERQLVVVVHALAKRAGLSAMPEVGIYQSPESNAFATGPTQSRSLVAVSSGLLRNMNAGEVEGVLAHEMAHIANGDMVTMTLLQGVVNAFVMFFARVIAFALTRTSKDRNSSSIGSPALYMILVMVFEVVFMILGSVIVATYCRFREFQADAGGARLANRDKMVSALKALQRVIQVQDSSKQASAFQAFKISNPRGILRLFATHPPLEERIRRLESGRY